MNIKDFLIDNYIWILAIILITIVTIIGFLADKNKGGKKKENISPQPKPQQIEPINNNQQPMQYQPEQQNQMSQQPNVMSNNMNTASVEPINQNLSGNTMMNNQNMGTVPQQMVSEPQQPNAINTMNNPQPVENIVANVETEPMYQPLSEQKPNVPPQAVPSYDAIQNQNIQEQSITMNNMMPVGNNLNNGNNQFVHPQPKIEEQPQFTQQQSNYNMQPNMLENNNFVVPNMIPNQGTIPQPVNPIPVPQPIMPQPIMTNQMIPDGQMGQIPTYNMNQPTQNNNFQNPQSMQQNMMPTDRTMTMPQQQPSVNFVYGPQNNNQNM